MDGVAGVTQCPIPPSQSFVYDFNISSSQSGTFWYHSHSAIQRGDGLYGGLVIHRPATIRARQLDSARYNYQQEHLLLVGDWYHRSAEQILEWFLRPGSYGNEVLSSSR